MTLGCLWVFTGLVQAATVELDSYIQNGKVAVAIWNATQAAGNGGTVVLGAKTYLLDGDAYINKQITFKGQGRDLTTIKMVADKYTMLAVSAPNVVITDLTLHGDKRQAGGVWAILFRRATNLNVQRVRIAQCGTGILTDGDPPSGLRVFNVSFEHTRTGISFNRNWVTYPIAACDPPATIDSCSFSGVYNAGVTFDAGNDGSDGPQKDNLALRDQAKATITDFKLTTIKNCTFHQCAAFNIAVAKCSRINITNNTMFGGTPGVAYNQALHLEHQANTILVSNNRLRNDNPSAYASVAHITTFTDYGNAPSYANGCWGITIIGNEIRCGAPIAIAGDEFRLSSIKNNKWYTPMASAWDINFAWRSNLGCDNLTITGNTGLRTSKITVAPRVGMESTIVISN